MLALLLAALLSGWVDAGTCDYDASAPEGDSYCGATRFAAPLNRSGLAVGAWTVPGVPAPSVRWDARDPLGASGVTSHAFTATGSTEALGAPFCPSGDFAGVDEMDGRCMVARHFDGTNDFYSGGDIADCTGACSACALVRLPNPGAVNQVVAAQTNSVTVSGWGLYVNNGSALFSIANTVGGVAPTWDAAVRPGASAWGVLCGTGAAGGNVYVYVNGVQSAGAAHPGGTVTSAGHPMQIGAWRNGAAAGRAAGDIAWAAYWPSALTASQVKTVSQHLAGLLGTRGEQATYTSTGPVAAWVDGKLETFSDDMPILGAQIPPGLTGAGLPGAGYLSHPSNTTRNPSSRDLSTNWSTLAGTGIACAAGTLFRDGRNVCSITDDSAAAEESIFQANPKAGTPTTACVYAWTAAGAGSLDARYVETTGGGCTTPVVEQVAASVTTTPTLFSWSVAQQDANCTSFQWLFSPVADHSIVAQTGGPVFAVVQIVTGTNICPSIYCETAGAAVTCGGDLLTYALAQPVVSATGTLLGTTRLLYDMTPMGARQVLTEPFIWRMDDGGATTLFAFISNANNTLVVSAGTYLAGDVVTWAPGTTYVFDTRLNYATDVYQTLRSGAQVMLRTDALNSPTGLTRFHIGSNGTAGQHTGGWVFRNARIVR
jgi:hypothetical protein